MTPLARPYLQRPVLLDLHSQLRAAFPADRNRADLVKVDPAVFHRLDFPPQIRHSCSEVIRELLQGGRCRLADPLQVPANRSEAKAC